MVWRPLSARAPGAADVHDGPHDGVPDWLRGPLWRWVSRWWSTDSQSGAQIVNAIVRLGALVRHDFEGGAPIHPRLSADLVKRVQEDVFANAELFLEVLDGMASQIYVEVYPGLAFWKS